MHFLVVGAGAMGCLFAARLRQSGAGVSLLEKIPESVRRISEDGIRVEGVSGDYRIEVPAYSDRPPRTPDVVLICVKSYHTMEAGRTINPWLERGTPILTLQNGIGNIENLETLFGKEAVLGGVTAEGATILGPGHIRHAGRGETLIGPGGAPGGPVEGIVRAFNRAGFKTRAIENVQDLVWGKLIINVGINALTALTGLRNGRLPDFRGTRAVMAAAVAEAAAVARARGIRLPYPDPLGRVLEVCEATSGNVASMLQDVLKEQVTEIEYINGAIVREGLAVRVPTPVNATLTSLVETLHATYAERVRHP